MKRNNKKRLILLIVTMALIMSCFMIFATADSGDKIDAMTEIEANLSKYKVGETVSVAKATRSLFKIKFFANSKELSLILQIFVLLENFIFVFV